LKYSFFPSPIVPGPESVQNEIVQKRNLNCYEAGEKIEKPHDLGEEPEEEHIDHKSPGSHQAEFRYAPDFLPVNHRTDAGAQLWITLMTSPSSFPSFPPEV
jgi:hypothetical protein